MQINGVTQSELAERSGVSQGAISRYLNGKASPKAEELLKLADTLNVDMKWLMTGEGFSPERAAAGDGAAIKRVKTEAERLARLLGEAEGSIARIRAFLG